MILVSPRSPLGTLRRCCTRGITYKARKGPEREGEALRMSLILTETNLIPLLWSGFGYPLPSTPLPFSLSSPNPPLASPLSLLPRFQPERTGRLIHANTNRGDGNVFLQLEAFSRSLFVEVRTPPSPSWTLPCLLTPPQAFPDHSTGNKRVLTAGSSSLLTSARGSTSHRGPWKSPTGKGGLRAHQSRNFVN